METTNELSPFIPFTSDYGFTMKALSNTQQKPIEYPKFWTEEWLKIAIQELDTRAMTPEQRMAYEMTLANNAEAIRQEKEKIAAAKAEGEAMGKTELKVEAARRMIGMGMDDDTIALILEETLEFVRNIRSGASNTPAQ